MIVEIEGVSEEKMVAIEELFSRKANFLAKAEGFDKKIRFSVGTGNAEWVSTHRSVWSGKDIRVFFREPGELCLTIEGSLELVVVVLAMFMQFGIMNTVPAWGLVERARTS